MLTSDKSESNFSCWQKLQTHLQLSTDGERKVARIFFALLTFVCLALTLYGGITAICKDVRIITLHAAPFIFGFGGIASLLSFFLYETFSVVPKKSE